MPFLTIKKLKGSASFQDLGRNSAQHLGFSGSGAADEYSYLLANKLIGNELNDNNLINNEKIINQHSDVTLEVTLGQFTLITNQTCRLVITGADCQSHICKKNGEENGATI